MQEMLVHFHPTTALLIVLALLLGAFGLLPFLGGDAASDGVWFVSAVGRRTPVFDAAAAGLTTPIAVVLDEYVIDFAGWLAGWPQIVSNGLIPAAFSVAVVAGVASAARTVFRAHRQEVVQAVFVFLIVGFVELTLICIFFRAEGMKLGWAL